MLGGPDNTRAYPIADALRDKGYYTSLEYTSSARFRRQGLAVLRSAVARIARVRGIRGLRQGVFGGRNRLHHAGSATLSGAGAGLIFRLPRFSRSRSTSTARCPWVLRMRLIERLPHLFWIQLHVLTDDDHEQEHCPASVAVTCAVAAHASAPALVTALPLRKTWPISLCVGTGPGLDRVQRRCAGRRPHGGVVVGGTGTITQSRE